MGKINKRKTMKKIMFVNIAWMHSYKVLPKDIPKGGSGWIKDGGPEHAQFNFLPFANKMYGYAPPGTKDVEISRLGAKSKDESTSSVLVIWMGLGSRTQFKKTFIGS